MKGDSITVRGEGSHANPWQLHTSGSRTASNLSPASIGLKDNLAGIFQSSPHSPIDMAVIFNNLRRLGTQKLAFSPMLSWDEPDAIGLVAMENTLSEFNSVVLAAPVTRGATAESLPPYFRRASLATESISCDLSGIPVVNRVSIPNLIHGGENSLAGFGVIDSEPTTEAIHLIARWDDRIVFAFPVVAAAQNLEIGVDDLLIKVGSHIQFGKQGPKVKIDEFGRLAIDFDQEVETDLLAEDLIDAELSMSELPALKNTLLCDLRSHADITTRHFNRLLIPSIEKLMSGHTESGQGDFIRLASQWELFILFVVAFSWSIGTYRNWIILVAQLALLPIAVFWGMRHGIWLPGLGMIIIVLIGWVCSSFFGRGRKQTTSMPRLGRLLFKTNSEDRMKIPDSSDHSAESQDYALAPKNAGLDSTHESD